MPVARVRFSVVLHSGARIGPGKIELLHCVQDSGSISAAARAMDMDYKRAWTLIESLNLAFDTPVVVRVRGGTHGGGAVLTPFGVDLLARYRKIEAAVARATSSDLRSLQRHALPEAGPKI